LAFSIQRRIDELYTACPFYGVRKMTTQLRADGLLVNHKAVARHLHIPELRALYPGPTSVNARSSTLSTPFCCAG
jgi:putative transposase